MYQLQILFHKQGDWENTVYQPMELNRVQSILKHYQSVWGNTHSYRITPINWNHEINSHYHHRYSSLAVNRCETIHV